MLSYLNTRHFAYYINYFLLSKTINLFIRKPSIPVMALDVKLQIFAQAVPLNENIFIRVSLDTTTASISDNSPTTEMYCR